MPSLRAVSEAAGTRSSALVRCSRVHPVWSLHVVCPCTLNVSAWLYVCFYVCEQIFDAIHLHVCECMHICGHKFTWLCECTVCAWSCVFPHECVCLHGCVCLHVPECGFAGLMGCTLRACIYMVVFRVFVHVCLHDCACAYIGYYVCTHVSVCMVVCLYVCECIFASCLCLYCVNVCLCDCVCTCASPETLLCVGLHMSAWLCMLHWVHVCMVQCLYMCISAWLFISMCVHCCVCACA